MIKIEKTVTYGWEAAIRGLRNPMNSWDKSDSAGCYDRESCEDCPRQLENGECSIPFNEDIVLGPNDHGLMMRLRKAGTDHRKFMRMIMVSVDITAPLYWWKEFDTYKVGTVANSCSTMHKIHSAPFSINDFSHDRMSERALVCLGNVIEVLEASRWDFNETKDKAYWDDMIQLLPSSYNQKRTVMLNYEVLCNMYHSRKNHKLDEWHTLCDWIKNLPYSELITGEE